MKTRTTFTVLAGATMVVAGVATMAGQRTGTGAPPMRGEITKHSYPLDDDHYLRWPLPAGEQAYGKIDGVHLKQYVNEITGIARQSRDDGNQYWGRISGTKYDDMAEAWVEAKFKAAGLTNIHRQWFDLPPQWFPTKWDVSLGGTKIPTARPAARSVATPAAGLDVEAVWVGLGTDADFATRDVKGKAAVIYSIPTPSVINHSAVFYGAMKRAQEKGAAAAIVILGIPGNFQNEFNNTAEGIPTFSVGIDDGASIREAIEKGGARIKMNLSVEMRPGLRDASVWGELPGTTDEDIVVMAHHDSYFQGALDNASGMSVMVGLAEHFAKIPKAQRRRTMKFVTTSGHHNGSLGTKWMHDNRETFFAKNALLLNCEHVSVTQTYYWGANLRKSNQTDARRWWVYGSDKLANMALDAYKTFGVAVYHEMEPNASGDMGQASLDTPSVQMIESPAFYHSDHDTPEIVPVSGLEAVARAYAKLIDQVNKVDRRELVGTPGTRTTAGQ